jgi:hypothetical protein
VSLETVADLPVRLDDLAKTPGGGLVALVDGRRGDEARDVEVVRIRQEPHRGLGVVGLVLDICQHEHAHLVSDSSVSRENEKEARKE